MVVVVWSFRRCRSLKILLGGFAPDMVSASLEISGSPHTGFINSINELLEPPTPYRQPAHDNPSTIKQNGRIRREDQSYEGVAHPEDRVEHFRRRVWR